LIPQGYALVANEKSVKQLEFNKRMIEKKINSELAKANDLASRLAACEIKISKKVGDEGKLFGSVTSREIGDALKEKGFDIDHRDLIIDSNIKKSGVYEVEVKLFREVRGVFKLFVVSEDSEEAPVQAAE
ncbi:50S ribosomal protein L9, partial [bacterium]|nr:50S ribosomal protein L9 [bacterium]